MNIFKQIHLVLVFSSLSLWGQSKISDNIRKSLVKIRVVSQALNYKTPWKYLNQRKSSGTGFFIGYNKILTNAHVVANAKSITIQRDGSPKLSTAFVKFIAHDCDLALLELKDPQNYRDNPFLKFHDKVPEINSEVLAIGYPTGGELISITRGIASRIGFRYYVHSGFSSHLLVQVDSAINPGNSGGPVIQKGKVIGVAFQAYRSAENTGYIIPTPIINRFLEDIKDGSYDGHPIDGIVEQPWTLSHQETYQHHGLDKAAGIKISFIAAQSPLHEYLKPNDVILKIDGKTIDVDGKSLQYNERINFKNLIDLKLHGEKIKLLISRDQQIKNIEVTIHKKKPGPFSNYKYGNNAPYKIITGLVFTPMSTDWLKLDNYQWRRRSPWWLEYLLYYSERDSALKEIDNYVVLTTILPDSSNTYDTIFHKKIVKKVNSQTIKSFSGFVESINSSTQDMIKIEFFNTDMPLYVSKYDMQKNDLDILKKYQVPKLEELSLSKDGAIQKEDLQ
jgi:S1-C subfamily serine protease